MNDTGKRYWNMNGHYEVSGARSTLVLLVVVAAMGLVIWGQFRHNETLQTANDYLEQHRVMWATRNSDGTYVSSDVRPTDMVSAFARQFLNNLYNYDPQSAKNNFAAALKMDDPVKAVDDAESLLKEENDVESQNIISSFLIYQEKDLVEKDDTYIYECQGRQRVLTTTTPVSNTLYDVVLTLKKVPPTESNRYGLVVYGPPTLTPVGD